MRKLSLLMLCAAALAGCRSTDTTALADAVFDANEAAFIKKVGAATISGHAFWRNDNGGTINAAGEIIRLVPATAYSRQRFAVLYRGKRQVGVYQMQEAPADPQYAEFTRTTRAESNGRFEFDKVAPGQYFVLAQIRYRDRSDSLDFGYNNFLSLGYQGGHVYETVTVTGKEEKAIKLVLTNERYR